VVLVRELHSEFRRCVMEEHESEEQMQEGGRGRSRGNSAMEVNSEPLI
jgi:hypothetical protein